MNKQDYSYYDEYEDTDIYDDPEPEPWHMLGVCCYDPRYDFPGGDCLCAIMAREERLANRPFAKFKRRVSDIYIRFRRWVVSCLPEKEIDLEDLPF